MIGTTTPAATLPLELLLPSPDDPLDVAGKNAIIPKWQMVSSATAHLLLL